MTVIPEKTKSQLRKPLGRVYRDVGFMKKMRGRRAVVVGDESVIAFLKSGLKPHLAVFDFKIMRKRISRENRSLLLSSFENVRKYKNRKGTLSGYLLKKAGFFIRKGGALLIDGEEDLTALAFILKGSKKEVVVYGQPKKGLVVVKPEEGVKKVKSILAGTALGHKVE